MTTQFDSLLAEVRNCTLCAANIPLAPRPILQAHPSARLLIAGQAPGVRTHHVGIPFDDASGNRLRDWLGINRETFYNAKKVAIVPMGFCYPGTGKSGDLPPRTECSQTWHESLFSALPNIQLKLVIGQYAIGYHLPNERDSLTEVVKNWQKYWPNILPLPHPSPRNNLWLKRNLWFEAELLPVLKTKVAELLKLADST